MKGMECVLFPEVYAAFSDWIGGKKLEEVTFAFYVSVSVWLEVKISLEVNDACCKNWLKLMKINQWFT